MDKTLTIVSNEEKVARVLHRDWLVGNQLQLGAFAHLKAALESGLKRY